MHDISDEKICEGIAVCWQCGKTVNGRVVLRKNEDLCYLLYECPEDGKYEQVMCKGRPSSSGATPRGVPSYWPYLKAQAGQVWDDINIMNRENIPVLVFVTTLKCNSSCKICAVPEFGGGQQGPQGISFLKEKLSFYKHKEVVLCGGEPTTRDDLPHLIATVRRTGNTPVIQTNGLRLADRNFVKELRTSGLRHVHLSFDGFDEEVYGKIRGGKHEYALKMRALTNLIKEDFRISLTSVVMKGINEGAVKELIDYARRTRHITGLSFLCLSLTGAALKNGFNAGNMLSDDEIQMLAAEAAGITAEDFRLWDELKVDLAFYMEALKSAFPFLPMPVFRNGIVYMKRRPAGAAPLFNKDELRRLISMVRAGRGARLAFFLGPVIARMAFRNCLFPSLREGEFFYKEKIFKISVVSPLSTCLFSSNSLATFGFFDPNIGMCNSLHQR